MRRIMRVFLATAISTSFIVFLSEMGDSRAGQENLWLIGLDNLYLLDADSRGVQQVETVTDFDNDGTMVAMTGDQLLQFTPDTLLQEGIRVFDLSSAGISASSIDLPNADEVTFEQAYFAEPIFDRFVPLLTVVDRRTPEQLSLLPNPEWVVNGIWLIDLEEEVALRWYWGCGEIVLVGPTSTLGLFCSPLEMLGAAPTQAGNIFLLPTGFEDVNDTEYTTIHGDIRDDDFSGSRDWVFGHSGQNVVYESRTPEEISVNVYHSGAEPYELVSSSLIGDVARFIWSPSETFVAIQFIANRLEIRRIEDGALVWSGDELISHELPPSFAWKRDESGFFVLHSISANKHLLEFSFAIPNDVVLENNLQVPGSIFRIEVTED